jgi:uncharacterized protein YjbI with pentapeptide repeats
VRDWCELAGLCLHVACHLGIIKSRVDDMILTGEMAVQEQIYARSLLVLGIFLMLWQGAFSGEQAKIIDFSGQKLSNQVFSWQNWIFVSFSMSNLDQINFNNVNLTESDFSEASLNNFVFNNCNLTKVNFNKAKLNRVSFINCKLPGAIFGGASLENSSIDSSNMDQTNWLDASLSNTQFKGVSSGLTAVGAKFNQASFNNVTGLVNLLDDNKTLASGISFKDAKFYNISFANIKLRDNYDFTGAKFSGELASFIRTQFWESAIFANTQFEGLPFEMKFNDAEVWPVGSYEAIQKGLVFFETQINGTNFSGAKFNYTVFNYVRANNANFKGATFTNCKMISSTIGGDLSCTKIVGGIIKVNDFTASKLNGSDISKWVEQDADGLIGGANGLMGSSNVYPPGFTYDVPKAIYRFECQA